MRLYEPLKGHFFDFFQYVIQHCFICRPSASIVSEDAVIERRFVALTTPLDLIQMSLTATCLHDSFFYYFFNHS
jgi:hypothetical protein